VSFPLQSRSRVRVCGLSLSPFLWKVSLCTVSPSFPGGFRLPAVPLCRLSELHYDLRRTGSTLAPHGNFLFFSSKSLLASFPDRVPACAKGNLSPLPCPVLQLPSLIGLRRLVFPVGVPVSVLGTNSPLYLLLPPSPFFVFHDPFFWSFRFSCCLSTVCFVATGLNLFLSVSLFFFVYFSFFSRSRLRSANVPFS